VTARRFPIRFTGVWKAMSVLGLSPRNSAVELTDDDVIVRLSWTFHAQFPRTSIRSAEPDHDRVTGWGAHGWDGVWLVNGSSSGIVRITIDPEASAHVLGWPVRLRMLRVAVDDPDGLIAALTSP
jgi:hypothetical protein